jgi:alpha-glucosidase (family GH31 glycosyl hydrolase)
MGLCGIPYWGTDTGGFVPTEELTPELYVRWFQFSAFCPLFRSHGRTWKLRLPWGWNMGSAGPLEGAEEVGNGWPPPQDLHDAEVETICRKYLELRYQLMPYLYSTVDQAHRTGMPLMRALWVAFPDEAKALLIDDQYMWGDHFLVAPVVEKGAAQRKAWLPQGLWWDFWSSERVEGGVEVSRKLDLSTLPLWVRAGAIVPMGPVRQYAMEPSDEPVTLRIYPGAPAKFSWYEDDGSSFHYRNGDFTRVACAWEDDSRILTLRYDPQGRPFSSRKVRVEVVGKPGAKTVTLGSAPSVEVRF